MFAVSRAMNERVYSIFVGIIMIIIIHRYVLDLGINDSDHRIFGHERGARSSEKKKTTNSKIRFYLRGSFRKLSIQRIQL